MTNKKLTLRIIVKKKNLPNNIAENSIIGIKQFISMRNPNNRFPRRAPPLPKVRDNAAAMTLLNINLLLNKRNYLSLFIYF